MMKVVWKVKFFFPSRSLEAMIDSFWPASHLFFRCPVTCLKRWSTWRSWSSVTTTWWVIAHGACNTLNGLCRRNTRTQETIGADIHPVGESAGYLCLSVEHPAWSRQLSRHAPAGGCGHLSTRATWARLIWPQERPHKQTHSIVFTRVTQNTHCMNNLVFPLSAVTH